MGYKIIKYFVRYLLDHNSKQAIITHFLICKKIPWHFSYEISLICFSVIYLLYNSAESQMRILFCKLFVSIETLCKLHFILYNLSHIFSLDYFETIFIVAERKICIYELYVRDYLCLIPRFNYRNM